MEMRYGSLYQTKEKERLYDESLLISLFFSPIPQSFHNYISLYISPSLYISLSPSPSLPLCSLLNSLSQNIFLRSRIFLFSSYYFSLSSLLFPKSFPVYVSKPFFHFSLYKFLAMSLSISPAIYLT